MQTYDKKGKWHIYVLTLLMTVVTMAIFLNSFYWPYEEIGERRILVYGIALTCVVVVPILAVKVNFLNGFVQRFVKFVADLCLKVKAEKKRLILWLGMILAGVGLVAVLTFAISALVLHGTFNVHLFYAGVAMVLLVCFIVFEWKNADRKIEHIFVVVALVMGILCISVTPSRTGVAPDDEIHYARSLEISNWMNHIMYKADIKNIDDYGVNIGGRVGYDRKSDQEYKETLESLYETRETQPHEFGDYDIWSIAYVPSAVGIVLGRGLGLSYAGVFNMGRLFNLVTYILLIFFSIRKIKYGKILVTCIGLIPGTIFLASSYSYDSWVTGFIVLGFSYFFAELQDDKPLKYRNIIIMVVSIVIGSIPKAIYFAVLFPLLFMPKKKFDNSKKRKVYYAIIVIAALMLMSTFVLPRLIGGMGTGDLRGGADVNSTEQVKFILRHPLRYAKILFEFLFGNYVTLGSISRAMQAYGYMANGFFGGVVIIILMGLAVFDNGKNEKKYLIVDGATICGVAATIVLASTALYVSFTAVASNTIAGMQGRYLIPLLYPAFYALGMRGVQHKISKKVLECLPILIIAGTFIFNLGWQNAVFY